VRSIAAAIETAHALKVPERIHSLSSLQVFEVGKQWDQGCADVTEAKDYLEYNGREMTRLGSRKRMGRAPGEINHYPYQPRGIAAVIAPWNFPLAISCGMSSSSLVTGFLLAELFRDAGLPAGVFNYVPGRGSVTGDYLVENPDISLIAFTGSQEVGVGIIEIAD
jgi:RHH-type transcriptional regulator, proline utilization regulon repressor / proline dehydrogenase / delta 1-pyrroline-5-carboxylate dehydrogenase